VSNSERLLLTDCLRVSMEFRFYAMLCSNLGNEKSDEDQIKCSLGPHLVRDLQVPHAPVHDQGWIYTQVIQSNFLPSVNNPKSKMKTI